MKGQTAESLRHDAETLAFLNPEQITLYELRTNMIKEESHLSKQELFYFYSYLYNKLISMGYSARFGQNTFSKSPTDMGVSSYLRSRMLEGVAYKGFGISAQSMITKAWHIMQASHQKISSHYSPTKPSTRSLHTDFRQPNWHQNT